MTSQSIYVFKTPCVKPLDAVLRQILMALQERGCEVPGVQVEITPETIWGTTYYVVTSISGPGFCLDLDRMGVNRVTFGHQRLDFHGDAQPSLYIYRGLRLRNWLRLRTGDPGEVWEELLEYRYTDPRPDYRVYQGRCDVHHGSPPYVLHSHDWHGRSQLHPLLVSDRRQLKTDEVFEEFAAKMRGLLARIEKHPVN